MLSSPYLVGVFAKKETGDQRNYGFYAGHDRQCSRRIAEHNSKKSKQKRFDDVQDELMMNLAENKQNIPIHYSICLFFIVDFARPSFFGSTSH